MGWGGLASVWWVFVVVGITLMIAEIFTPGFVILWFGIAAIITAIPVYLGASPVEVILSYAVSVLLLGVFGRRLVLRISSLSGERGVETNVSALIGCDGVVVEEVDPVRGLGRVRVRGEIWSAVSEDRTTVAKDETVVVHAVDGVKLVVRKEA